MKRFAKKSKNLTALSEIQASVIKDFVGETDSFIKYLSGTADYLNEIPLLFPSSDLVVIDLKKTVNPLAPFMDILSLSDFLSDSRLAWSDVALFSYISLNANANDWQVISKQCPVEVLERHILEDLPWNWSTVSRRISTGFIVSHPNDCKWDFSVISNRDDIKPEDIKALLGSVSSSR